MSDRDEYIAMLARARIPFRLSVGVDSQDGPPLSNGEMGVVTMPPDHGFYVVHEFTADGRLKSVGAFEP